MLGRYVVVVLAILLLICNLASAQIATSKLTNRSGSAANVGAVVVVDTVNASSFVKTTTEADGGVVGVVFRANIADDATGYVMISGIVDVTCIGAVAIGDFLITSTTSGSAKSNGTTPIGSFAIALEAGTATDISCFIYNGPAVLNASGDFVLDAHLNILDDKYIKAGTNTDIWYGYDEAGDNRAEWTDGTNLLQWLTDSGTTGDGGVTGVWTVGAGAVGNIGTPTNPNQLQFTSATATTLESDLTLNRGAAATFNLGQNDTYYGIANLYGASDTTPGQFRIYAGATADTDNEWWGVKCSANTTGDFAITDDANSPKLTIDAATFLATTAGDLTVSGGDLLVGAAADGNIGTTTNPTLLQMSAGGVTVLAGKVLVANTRIQTAQLGVSGDTDLMDLSANLLTVNGGITANSLLSITNSSGTSADGIRFWTDTYLYRSAAGVLSTPGGITMNGAFVRTPVTITTDTTPTAVGRAFIIIGAWTAVNDITDFDNETAGQVLKILGGDVDCNVVDGAPIQLVGGTTWNGKAGATLELWSDGTIWYEASRSDAS